MLNEHPHEFLDSSFESLLDSILLTAVEVCGCSLAFISFRDTEQQIFKPNAGPAAILDSLRHTSLAEDVSEIGKLVEVCDASQDDRFWDKPYVIAVPYLRFIAGVPIRRPLGEITGVLCVIDTKPKYLNAQQRTALDGLANIVSKAIVARKSSLRFVTNPK